MVEARHVSLFARSPGPGEQHTQRDGKAGQRKRTICNTNRGLPPAFLAVEDGDQGEDQGRAEQNAAHEHSADDTKALLPALPRAVRVSPDPCQHHHDRPAERGDREQIKSDHPGECARARQA